eukprot:g2791.t1
MHPLTRCGTMSRFAAVTLRRALSSSAPPAGYAVMVNGIPGRMGTGLAEAVVQRWGSSILLPFGLTGEGQGGTVRVADMDVELFEPSSRDKEWDRVLAYAEESNKRVVAIDFTHPDAALGNVEFYAKNDVPFVMGTTGGDATKMEAAVEAAPDLYAVIAPNMGKPIVWFQAMIEAGAAAFPGALRGYKIDIVESHQTGKADTSGTARAVVSSMAGLGLEGAEEGNIHMIRDPPTQSAEMGVPEEHLKHHAFHTYRIASEDSTVEIIMEHNICGSAVYHDGTLDALAFLLRQKEMGNPKRLWSMIDVLREGG